MTQVASIRVQRICNESREEERATSVHCHPASLEYVVRDLPLVQRSFSHLGSPAVSNMVGCLMHPRVDQKMRSRQV